MKKPKTPSRAAPHTVMPRSVYLCTMHGKSEIVEATAVSDLAKRLAPLLGIEPYSVQAIARIAHLERATITTPSWTIRRLGTLQFASDDDDVASRTKVADLPKNEVPTPTALPGEVSTLPDRMAENDTDH